MHPRLERISLQIIQHHPNLISPFFRKIKAHLPFGLGEGKVRDAIADNIPEWLYDLTDQDLKEFLEKLQRDDPAFYMWLRFQIAELEKHIYE